MTEAVRARNAAIQMPRGTQHFEALKRILNGEVSGPPVAELIGFAPTRVELGECDMEMRAERRHANPMGTLHGGILCDMADAAMGFALSTTLEDDESFTTLDITINFFKPIWESRIKAAARVTRRTRSIGFIECEITDEKGSLVAKSFSTCMVLRGEMAKGR